MIFRPIHALAALRGSSHQFSRPNAPRICQSVVGYGCVAGIGRRWGDRMGCRNRVGETNFCYFSGRLGLGGQHFAVTGRSRPQGPPFYHS